MKVFIAFSTLLVLASADQSSHQTIQRGHAAPVHTSIHKPHGLLHASVVSQPAADPSDVHNPYNADHKPIAAFHAPAHIPVGHRPAPFHPLPHHPVPFHAVPHHPGPFHPVPHHSAPFHPAPHHPAPFHHAPHHPAPFHHAPYHQAPFHHGPVFHPAPHHPLPVHHAPVFHPAPLVHRPVVHPAPLVHPAPVVHRPVVHPTPLVHPGPVHPEIYADTPAIYQYGYAVADDYAGTNFAANENRDGYSTNGEYRVALPDGRTQVVTYNVADAYSGYVADVKYEGEPAHPAPAPYHA